MRIAGRCRGVGRVLLTAALVGSVSAAMVLLAPASAGATARHPATGRDRTRDRSGPRRAGRPLRSAVSGPTPNLAAAVGYLTSTTNLVDGSNYEPDGPGYADIGLTIDGALALAAAGTARGAVANMVAYVGANGASWTGYGTSEASGGSLGKEAVLAEAVSEDPRNFGGENLISALDATVCQAASTGIDTSCAAAGNYAYSSSTFDQALGIIAQVRAGDSANAAAPIRYLESLQNGNGGWPSVLPPGTSPASDVDSTALAVMALALVSGHRASAAVKKGIKWIAGQQESNGGFPGAAGDNTNSAALALMAMDLKSATYAGNIQAGLAFVAAEQNLDGGFNISADPGSQQGSDLRATTQAVSGTVGTSFGTLRTTVGLPSPAPPSSNPPAGTATGTGYWDVASDGGVFAFGDATFHGSTGGIPLNQPVVGMAPTPDGKGYWEVASDGGIFAFGDATFHGSMGGIPLDKPVVGMAPTPDGKGYWEVASDGGIFAFGDATFHGSTGGIPLNQPVVGMAPTPDGKGYWEVASDGGIFAFGDATFHGSMGGIPLDKPVVGMAPTPDGKGYWEVASDGGIFAFGDATFHGSMGGIPLNQPVVGMAPTPDGKGYWEVASDGGIFAFGDATFHGSMGGIPLDKPVVGMAPAGGG